MIPRHCLLFLLLSIILLIAIAAQGPAMMSDQYERARAAGEIIRQGAVPKELPIYEPAPPNTYAPGFDLFFAAALSAAGTTAAGGIPPQIFFTLLSFVALFLIFTYSYKISRLYLNPHYSACSACLASLLPWVFRRELSPIPESLGLAIFLVLLYYLLKRNMNVLAILFPLLALLHYRSFLTFAAVYIVFCCWVLWKREMKLGALLKPVPMLAVAAAAWFLPRLSSFAAFAASAPNSFQNPWLVSYAIVDMFGIAALLATLFIAYEFGRTKRLSALSALFAAGLAVSLLPLGNFAFRESAYVFFPAAFLSICVLKKFDEKFGRKAGSALLVLLFLSVAAGNAPIMLENEFFTAEYVAGVSALGEFADARPGGVSALGEFSEGGKGMVVVGDFVSGYLIPYYANSRIVAGPFMESLPDAQQRASDTWNAFANCKFPAGLFGRYNAEVLYISPNAGERFNCMLPEIPPKTAKIYASDRSAAYVVSV